MSELFAAIGGSALWLAAFAVVVVLARRFFPGERGASLLAAYPVFFAAQVILARLAGAAGLLTTGAMLGVYGAFVGAGTIAVWAARRRSALPAQAASPAPADPDVSLIRRIAIACCCVVLAGLTLFALVAPVHIWDVLAYHMPMVASYIQNGSLEAWPTQDLRHVFRVNAGELQMLNVALLGHSDALVEVPNLLGLFVLLVATLELARLEYADTARPYIAVLLVLTAPQILIGAATGKNDLVFTAMLIASFYWMIRAALVHGRRQVAFLLLAALAGAVAAATKVMGLNVLGAVGVLALVLVVRRRLPFRGVVLFGVAAAVALLALAGTVYWSNLSRSAVPVGVAPGEVSFTIGPANAIAAARFYLYDLSFKRLVVPQVFEHDFMHYGYFFPFLLLAGTVVALRQFRARRFVLAALALMGGVLFLSVIALRLPIQWDQRFMMWMVPALAVLALWLTRHWQGRSLVAVAAAAAAVAVLNVTLTLTDEADALFNRSALHLAGTGTLARYADVPNERYMYMNAGFEVVDLQAMPGDSVLYVGSDDSWMYPAWGARFTRHVEGVSGAGHAAEQVASRRFRFVIVEDVAREEVRHASAAAAAAAGYDELVRADGRVVYMRPGSTPPAGGRRQP